MVVLSLQARLADEASDRLVIRKLFFDWEPEERRPSHLRDSSAIDNAAVVTYWKTHREKFLFKPELFLEKSEVDILCVRLKCYSIRDASCEVQHDLVPLLDACSSVLREAHGG